MAKIFALFIIEMIYHLQLNAALGPEMKFLGITLDAKGLNSWFGLAFVMLTGLGLFELCRRQFARDGLHYSRAQMRQWAELVLPVVQAQLALSPAGSPQSPTVQY